jgi:hypothetical protein
MLATDGLTETAGEFYREADGFKFLSGHFGWFGALWTEFAHKPLCQEGADGRAHQEWFHTHVEESGNAPNGIIGVKRAKD